MITAVAIDLGTTGIKAAALQDDGSLTPVERTPAPPLEGEGLVSESDPVSYLNRATSLLARFTSGLPPAVPVGIASQRSSFLLWEKGSGRPVTPLISWQDRRATSWCERHTEYRAAVAERTGLPLSPHYAGPKLADLFCEDPGLRQSASDGRLLFGTLESWIIWNNSSSRTHTTDLSMAGRTLLADTVRGTWSGKLLELFGVPPLLLPCIGPTWGSMVPLRGGGIVTATAADQAAALLSAPRRGASQALINLGSGGFVLFPVKSGGARADGYLSGPLCRGPGGEELTALEGTINGIASALGALGPEEPDLPQQDPAPDQFCLPDTSGAGAPFWRPGLKQLFSVSPSRLERAELGRTVREGIIFRVRQIVDDLEDAAGPRRLYLAGGISRDTFIAEGLAACMGRPLHRLAESEASLYGAARLAAGLPESDFHDDSAAIHPSTGGYLKEKYRRWLRWITASI